MACCGKEGSSTSVKDACVCVHLWTFLGILCLLMVAEVPTSASAAAAEGITTAFADLGHRYPSYGLVPAHLYFRMPQHRRYYMVEDFEGLEDSSGTEWMSYYPANSLLSVVLPATYMSTLRDVNVQKYVGFAETQENGVTEQLLDGVRMIDVRLWRDDAKQDTTSQWFTEVPWRTPEDVRIIEKAKGKMTGSGDLPEEFHSAVEVHSSTDLVISLFKPVLEFVRKSSSEVVVVVFSAVNGNSQTVDNRIVDGGELAASLQHSKALLAQFESDSSSYSQSEFRSQEISNDKPRKIRIAPPSGFRNSFLESRVRKSVTFKDFASITDLIDTFWGQLLPRHGGTFTTEEHSLRMVDSSVVNPVAFRRWQRSRGESILATPLVKLVDNKIRVVLLVDDPLLAWFITTRSRSRVIALVKADHVYDITYKSEAHFAPCALPHSSLTGTAVDTFRATWADCRDRCKSSCTTNGVWNWEPDRQLRDFQDAVSSSSESSRADGELGSLWEDRTADIGFCRLFETGDARSAFRGIVQDASCAFDDLGSSPSLWDPKDVLKDIEASILPGVSFATADKQSGSRLTSVSGFDKSLSVLNGSSDGAHAKYFDTPKKLLRISFAPPAPQYGKLSLEGIGKTEGHADAVQPFSESLVQLVTSIAKTRHILERAEVKVRQVNAIQIMKYNRVRITQKPFVKANYFELVMVLNPSVVVTANLYRIPRNAKHLKFVAAGRIPGDSDGKNSTPSAAEKRSIMVWMFVLFAVALLCLLTWIYVVCWRSFYVRRFKPHNTQRCSVQIGGARASSVELVSRDALVKAQAADEHGSVFDAEPVVLGAGIGTTVKYEN